MQSKPISSFEPSTFAGLRYKVSIGHFADGSPAEVFLSNHKAGNASDVIARDAGILWSFCLQYGCPVGTIARAISRNSDGSPSGVIGAVLDAIASDGGEHECRRPHHHPID
jgi:hypothetical protein